MKLCHTSLKLCCQQILLKYTRCPSWDHYSNYSHAVTITKLLINNHVKYNIPDSEGLYINLDFTFYHISTLLANSHFYSIDRSAVKIKSRCSTMTIIILVENCTFENIFYKPIILFLVSPINRNIRFVNCNFHDNNGKLLISVGSRKNYGCSIVSNLNVKLNVSTKISLVRCQFSYNTVELIKIENTLGKLGKVNVLFESLSTKIKWGN